MDDSLRLFRLRWSGASRGFSEVSKEQIPAKSGNEK